MQYVEFNGHPLLRNEIFCEGPWGFNTRTSFFVSENTCLGVSKTRGRGLYFFQRMLLRLKAGLVSTPTLKHDSLKKG